MEERSIHGKPRQVLTLDHHSVRKRLNVRMQHLSCYPKVEAEVETPGPSLRGCNIYDNPDQGLMLLLVTIKVFT